MPNGASLIMDGEIILSGSVELDESAWLYGDSGGLFTPSMVREALSAFPGPVTIRLNSLGGDPYAGEGIRSMLAQHSGGTTVVVEGIAASAASLLFMGAGKRVMSKGSLLMIHDPSTFGWGNEEELLSVAAQLGHLADTYAAVYAEASGMTAEAVRAIMKTEVYLNAEEAVAQGFADEILVEAPRTAATAMSLAAARTAFANFKTGRAAMVARKNAGGSAGQSAAAGGSPAMTATTEEAEMPEQTPAAVPAANPAPVAPVTMAITPEQAVAADRKRQKDIRTMAAPFVASGALTQAEVDALIDDGTSADQAGMKFLATMSAAQPPIHRQPATIVRDETETRVNGLIDAMSGKVDGPAAEFRGIRARSLAMHLAGPQRKQFNDVDTVRAGMNSTKMTGGAFGVSDFTYITGAAMNRSLRAEYERRAATWQAVAGVPLQAADFRQMVIARFGGDLQLKKVLANGEYNSATLNDNGDTIQVERRGRMINLTFEAVINDDMSAFTRIPSEFAMQARIMENSMVWNLIRTNPALSSDSVALFHATHKNLAASGTVISAASVGLGRKAMWEQTALGVKDVDDFLSIEPDRLIVPPNLEIAALQFVTQTTPASDGSVNPFKSTVQVVVVPNIGAAAGGTDINWFLVSSAYPPISVARLDGYDAPTITAVDNMNPDIKTFVARHIFGAAATEFRGAYKNPGA